MNSQHQAHGIVVLQIEHLIEHVHHELHRRVIVVQQSYRKRIDGLLRFARKDDFQLYSRGNPYSPRLFDDRAFPQGACRG